MTSMMSSLVSTDRHYLYSSFQDGVEYTLEEAMEKDNQYTLFRAQDATAWLVFSVVFAVLLVFDTWVINRTRHTMTLTRAMLYTMFWVLCACAFCGWVYWYKGPSQAFMWMSGYMLEWMLSFDNLFVFHMIFSVYATPDYLKQRPLYFGICGAIFFRLAFIFIGEYLMHAMFFMHFVFGVFLVYTGIKTITVDDEDEDPSQHPLVQWLQRSVPFVSAYDQQGRFFVRVPIDDAGEPVLPSASQQQAADVDMAEAQETRYGTVDFASDAAAQGSGRTQLRATMLFLVVICLEVSDLLFAVDSVSAIVAQVNDLFLAYTSAVFAMLGLRATFFIIDVLAKAFSLLKYGVAAVLVFIGVKLITSKMYHIPPSIVCIVLVASIAGSMVASVVQEQVEKAMAAKGMTETAQKAAERSPLLKPRALNA